METTKTPPGNLRGLLDDLADGLAELYGPRYRGLVLYGSYARGDAGEGSDVDLLLLLDGTVDVMHEMDHAQDVKWPLALEAGYTVSLIPVSADDYPMSYEPFLRNARREGLEIS